MRFLSWLFPPFDPETDRPRRFRRPIPVRMLIPNMITLLALCMGLTAIRLGIEGKFAMAIAAVVAAGVLDSLDGRVARLLKSTSRFGAELDSLADFVNFGVTPAILMYMWSLSDLGAMGWMGALAFSTCMGLRLARFNVALDAPQPKWQSNFFVGMPAPAAALTLLLPIFLYNSGFTFIKEQSAFLLVYIAIIAFLTVSRVPTYSGKLISARVPRHLVLPIFIFLMFVAAMLFSYPWITLSLSIATYIAFLPVGIYRYRILEAKHFEKNKDTVKKPKAENGTEKGS